MYDTKGQQPNFKRHKLGFITTKHLSALTKEHHQKDNTE